LPVRGHLGFYQDGRDFHRLAPVIAQERGPFGGDNEPVESALYSENTLEAGAQVGELCRSAQVSAAARRTHLAQPSSLFSCTRVQSPGMSRCFSNERFRHRYSSTMTS